MCAKKYGLRPEIIDFIRSHYDLEVALCKQMNIKNERLRDLLIENDDLRLVSIPVLETIANYINDNIDKFSYVGDALQIQARYEVFSFLIEKP